MSKALNLAGQVFGRLTVVEATTERRSRKVVWRCLCSCGKEHFITGSDLIHNGVKSCGCYSAELTASRNRANPNIHKYYPPVEAASLKRLYEDEGVSCGEITNRLRQVEGMESISLGAVTHLLRSAGTDIRDKKEAKRLVRKKPSAPSRSDSPALTDTARRAKQQTEREQSEVIERALNGETFR